MKQQYLTLTLELREHDSSREGTFTDKVYPVVKSTVEVKGDRGDIEDTLQRLVSNGLHILIDPGIDN